MKGLLVRVGIDQSFGHWNAPCREDGSFCYIPMQRQDEEFDQGFKTTYAEFEQDYQHFAGSEFHIPKKSDESCHLDPDFRYLTYGNRVSNPKGIKIKKAITGSTENFIAFYASFRPWGRDQEPLVYAIIGFYYFQNFCLAKDVPLDRRSQNAHTRLANYQRRDNEDIVIFADKNKSGRLKSLIEIGEYKNRQYYVQKTLYNAWGGFKSKNRWIQRGMKEFYDPDKFHKWFLAQNPELVNENNIHY